MKIGFTQIISNHNNINTTMFGMLLNEIQYHIFSFVNKSWFSYEEQKKDTYVLALRGYKTYEETLHANYVKFPTIEYLTSLPPVLVFQWSVYDYERSYFCTLVHGACKKNFPDEVIFTYLKCGFEHSSFDTSFIAKHKKWKLLNYYLNNGYSINMYTASDVAKHKEYAIFIRLFHMGHVKDKTLRNLLICDSIKDNDIYLLQLLYELFGIFDFKYALIKGPYSKYTLYYEKINLSTEILQWWWDHIETWTSDELKYYGHTLPALYDFCANK
jgi:hypothetical protein